MGIILFVIVVALLVPALVILSPLIGYYNPLLFVPLIIGVGLVAWKIAEVTGGIGTSRPQQSEDDE